MLRHKDVISVLLGAVAVSGVGSKPTFAKLVPLYISTIYKMISDKYLFMRNISRIRDRIIAKKLSRLSKLRNAKLQNCRLSYAANYSWCSLHHRVKQQLSDYFGLFSCISVFTLQSIIGRLFQFLAYTLGKIRSVCYDAASESVQWFRHLKWVLHV